MTFWPLSVITTQLSKKTSVFGLRLFVLIAAAAASLIILFLFLLPLCLRRRRRRRRQDQSHSLPLALKKQQPKVQAPAPISPRIIQIEEPTPVEKAQPKQHQQLLLTSAVEIGDVEKGGGGPPPPPAAGEVGWGRKYALRELDEATEGMAEENVIGEGGYGVVYRGVVKDDGTVVAVKNLLNNKGQAEKEFRVEVEAMGRVRHKHLVRLLGYCSEGEHRMLVYEYVDNGNLDQWLHGDVGEVSPLTWEIRMNIILGTAKGLAYLHEGLEPKVVHRDVKASNILLDQHWHPKISDFGLAKLLGSERTYVTTRVMGTFGYVAPEYASTGMLNERSDIYSFGVLIMEIISGRTPVDYRRPPGEVHLVEWLKAMVGERKTEQVVDPKFSKKPTSKALKHVLLVALHCIDPDSKKRPKMGNVIHMLEMDDLLFGDDGKVVQQASKFQNSYSNGKSIH